MQHSDMRSENLNQNTPLQGGAVGAQPFASCLSLFDLSVAQIQRVLALAQAMKANPQHYSQCLQGQSVALLFEKPSLRTRVSFDVGIYQLGGHAVYLDAKQVGPGSRETVTDIANNLACWTQAIVARVYDHATLQQLDQAQVPVINALCDQHHPCQTLADLLTLQELFADDLSSLKLAYVGDANNVCQSLMVGAAALNINLAVYCPPTLMPDPQFMRELEQAYPQHRIALHHDMQHAQDFDVIYTDTWVSMGEDAANSAAKKQSLADFQVNQQMLASTGAQYVMHCLPAHRDEEISSSLLDQQLSVVLRQAENRMHAQKALLALTLNPKFFTPNS